ncbi:hypothetical protein AB1Y20_006838 [Prymnesium parvum]|uniref:Amine oxidase domain-containing protein n=1 Tax=Prymnesium parvum TaxID=97485 RepID=A0AB34J1T6_PRYPA
MPSAIYLQAQRWGSALPAPIGVEGRDENGRSAATTVDILGVGYECALPPLVFARPTLPSVARSRDFAAVDEMKLFYAGDFCSSRSPGFEAAALSGRGAAQHIAQVMLH